MSSCLVGLIKAVEGITHQQAEGVSMVVIQRTVTMFLFIVFGSQCRIHMELGLDVIK